MSLECVGGPAVRSSTPRFPIAKSLWGEALFC